MKRTSRISEVDWTEICNIPDTQDSFDLFYSKLISLHEKCFPKINIRKKYFNRKPWLSDALRSSIRYKNKLYHKYKKIPSVKNETVYKSYRNKSNHVLKCAEKKYFRDLIISHKDNTRRSWSIIKKIINRHRKSNIQSKFKLNDGTFTDDKKLYPSHLTTFSLILGQHLLNLFPVLTSRLWVQWEIWLWNLYIYNL